MVHTVRKHLILGGARSGKSAYAEKLLIECAASTSKQAVYVATATAEDSEMVNRIARHQEDRRGNNWVLVEQSIDIASAVNEATSDHCLLIDCLSLWLSNCLHQDCWATQKQAFLDALNQCESEVVMVSNEVGSGVVPLGELSRRFVDEIGWLHQALAQQCENVTLMVAGLPSTLK